MILETYQEQQAIVQPDPPGQSFATVGTVYEDGIALIFNGAEAESLKHYKCNAAVRFTAGQRVRIIEDSGTYVVEYPVGAPAQSIYADSAARAAYASEAGHAETAKSAESAETAAQAENAAAAETAKNADFATRAGQVDNLAGNYADLVFSYSTQGTLLVRTTRDSQWTKLTGSVV